ncbi:MAG: ATP-binding protein [Candidatus Nealsonbacteria bacterium]|nr:ATP-binding protein [Candidatus Nealsonbacteria bacterium]
MLIQFSVGNYRSFREEQTLSLVASTDDAREHNLIRCDKGPRLTKVASLYGANASGKSNLITAMREMRGFVLASATKMNLGEKIDFVSPFRLDATSVAEPSRFEITLLLDGVTFVYGFSATRERVYDEWLHVRPSGGRFSKWLERTFDPVAGETSWAFRGPLRKDAKLVREKTRDNGLVLSRAAELNVDAVAPLFLWFQDEFLAFDLSAPPIEFVQFTAEMIRGSDDCRRDVLRFMRDADLGIRDLSVSEVSAVNIPDNAPDKVREFVTSLQQMVGSENLTRLAVTAEHATEDERSVSFSLEDDESNGTQRFFAIAGPVLSALAGGALLVIDELDCSIHPLLTRKIIELFQSEEFNTTGAQLVFATHDSSVMDPTLFRRDQIWLAEKRANGTTELFSLYDFDVESRPRKDAAFEKNYLAGRYGAIPSFGPSLEDVES